MISAKFPKATFTALFMALTTPAIAQAPAASFDIGLFGDLAYAPEREKQLAAVVADINATPLSFAVHVGDLGSPREGSCSDALWARRLEQFSTSVNPLIYTPGDNEWADCHDDQGVKGADPAERLAKLRAMFFQGEESFGKRKLPLLRQSADPKFAKYRENVRWDLGGVTFFTLHVVGSNNNRARTKEADAEYVEREAANLAWLRAGFEHAKASGSRAIMILQQGNMFPNLPPFPGDPKLEPSGFTELRNAVAKEALAFVKPVALVNGDSHFFRVDKPFMIRRSADPVVANFTRIETFGDPNHHWVKVTVDPADPNVFTVRQKIVPANVGAN